MGTDSGVKILYRCTEVLGEVCKPRLQHHEYSLCKESHKDNSGKDIFFAK